DLLHAQRGQDHRGKLAAALQHRASAWIARLQAAGTRGLHPGIRAGGPATPTSNAARAGAATIIALTIKLDPSVGADHDTESVCPQAIVVVVSIRSFLGRLNNVTDKRIVGAGCSSAERQADCKAT